MASKILFLGHDANRAGAQLVLLHWLRENKKNGVANFLLLEEGGVLLEEYKKVAKVWVWKKNKPRYHHLLYRKIFLKREKNSKTEEPGSFEVFRLLKILSFHQFDFILGNTIASISLMQKLTALNVKLGIYIHELNYSMDMYSNSKERAFLNDRVERIIGVSEEVCTMLESKFDIPKERIYLLPPVTYIPETKIGNSISNLKSQLKIPEEDKVVLSCGLSEWRKGTDLFLNVAGLVVKELSNVHFIWLGFQENEFGKELLLKRNELNLESQVHFIPVVENPLAYYLASDLFFLSSREDPFPLVMIEAAYVGLPVLGFKKCGGVSDFNKGLDHLLADYLDENQMSQLILYWLNLDPNRLQLAKEEMKRRALNYFPKAFIERWSSLNATFN